MTPENSRLALEYVKKAASLLRKSTSIQVFKDNFQEINSLIRKIPGHIDLVEDLGRKLDKLEEWQVFELRNSLLENLIKTQQLTQALLRTVD